jgi:hypothetical protein
LRRLANAVFKAIYGTVFVGVYISECMFSAFFNLHRTTSKQMKKTASMIFYIILLLIGHFTASCLHVILFPIFLDKYKIWHALSVSFLKK